MSAPLRALVIEDSPNSRDLLCEMLAVFGHHVQAAATAEDAIALFETNHFDVLFTDINLPGKSGIDLASAAVKIAPDVKIVFASGYGFLVADRTEFDFFLLPKPYGLDQLKYVLDQVTDSSNRETRLV